MNDLGMVIVAAGSSRRFGSKDKLMLDINGMPLFLNCIKTFLESIPPQNLVVVTSAERISEFSELITEKLGVNIRLLLGARKEKTHL